MSEHRRVRFTKRSMRVFRNMCSGGVMESDAADELLALLEMLEQHGFKSLPSDRVVDVDGDGSINLLLFGDPTMSAVITSCPRLDLVLDIVDGDSADADDIKAAIETVRFYQDRRARRA